MHQITNENGALAVEEAKQRHYDIILMDMQMPEMDGLQATRMIGQTLDRQPVIINGKYHAGRLPGMS
jgi:two-component system, sensor histidine kinase and response regulator